MLFCFFCQPVHLSCFLKFLSLSSHLLFCLSTIYLCFEFYFIICLHLQVKLNETVCTIPTIGFNVETVSPVKGVTFTVWDVGGQEKIRALWRHYYTNTQVGHMVTAKLMISLLKVQTKIWREGFPTEETYEYFSTLSYEIF